jgi:serine/threonine-protein phosphatase 2A regulatory subunit A
MRNLQQLTMVLGAKWAEKNIMPKLLGYQMHTNYLFRMIPLFAVPMLVPLLTQTYVEKTVVPFFLNQITDKVPNIRFNVAKGLKVIAPYVKNASLQSAITKALTQLTSDPDLEVKYFSSKYEVPASPNSS